MDVFGVLGYVGGIVSIFVDVFSFFIEPISELSFKMYAIMLLFKIKSKNAYKNIETIDLIKLITGFYPDKLHVKLLKLGEEKLSERLDFIFLLKQSKGSNSNEDTQNIIDLDKEVAPTEP